MYKMYVRSYLDYGNQLHDMMMKHLNISNIKKPWLYQVAGKALVPKTYMPNLDRKPSVTEQGIAGFVFITKF